MARQRLTWEKDAAMNKQADPYTMNQEHANNPVEKYKTGDPSTWAEDPDMKKPWADEGRNEVGLPAPAKEAVMAARKLEDKALKCITIAQRMLPGSADDLIEAQATDLMYMPERCVLATLQRQAELAQKLAAEVKEDEDDEKKKEKDAGAEKKDEEKEKDAAKVKDEEKDKAKDAAAEKKDEEKDKAKDAAAEKKDEEKDKAKDAAAEKKDEEKDKAKDAAADEKKDEVEKDKAKDAAADEKKDEVEKDKAKDANIEMDTASPGDLLDLIFAQEEPKSGVKKLSGIVKQASTSGADLDGLWSLPPDISKVFPRA